jgi:phosphatidylglycerol---prolipoprotein diacylglyceryl transferase
MYPVLLDLGGFRLHSYGVVVAAAMLIALWVGRREARRKGLDPEAIADLGILATLTGLAGARLAYVVGWEPELLWRDPLGVLAVWRGGLALHGGLLAGGVAGAWLARRRGLDPWVVGDTVAPGLILGQGIGRLACLLSGDAYGTPTRLPWAITFTDPAGLAPLGVPLHPAQLYEFGLDLVLFGVLWASRGRLDRRGELLLVYGLGYGAIRLLTEVVRGDRLELGAGLSLLQGTSLVLVGTAALALVLRRLSPAARRRE